MVLTITHREHRDTKAQEKLSAAEKLSLLTAPNERLDGHQWSDAQLRAIPSTLLQFAWDHSGPLREEFGSFGAFTAYLKADKQGRVRIASRREG